MPPNAKGRPRAGERPHGQRAATTTVSVADWTDTYTVATLWVRDCARERWPTFAANDDVWALSVTDWHHGGRRG